MVMWMGMRKGQTTIEFLLLLSVVVLLILAAITTVNDLTKVQQNATQAVRSGVENASLALLQQFAEQRVGLQLTNITVVDPNLARLEVSKSDVYFANQPSVIQVVVWNDYAGVMQVPEIRAKIEGPDGKEILSSPGSEFNVTITLARSITVTFIPAKVGNYNITVTSFNDAGQRLKQKKVPFTVVGGGVGGAEFVIEREIIAPRNSHFVETLQLPNASVRSATLEFVDMHTYIYRNMTAYAYDWIFKKSVLVGPSNSYAVGLAAFHDTNSPLDVVIPHDAILKDAQLVVYNGVVWLGSGYNDAPYAEGSLPTSAKLLDTLHAGSNLLNVQVESPTSGCSSLSCNHDVLAEARLYIEYYSPDSLSATAEQMMFNIKVNNQPVEPATGMDLSPYLGPGHNTINFTYINGTFTYRLRVVTG